MFSLVVAADRKLGIGLEGRLPWKRLKGDMRFFRDLTTCPDTAAVLARYRMDQGLKDKRRFTWEQLVARIGGAPPLPEPVDSVRNAVLMGRKTWDSLPPAYQPLSGRLNGVLSRSLPPGGIPGSHRVWPDFGSALLDLEKDPGVKNLMLIGGGEIYQQVIGMPNCTRIYLTSIDAEFPCDTFFPPIPADFQEIASSPWLKEDGVAYRFLVLERT